MILVDKLNKEKKNKGKWKNDGYMYNDKVTKMIEIIEITEKIESTQIQTQEHVLRRFTSILHKLIESTSRERERKREKEK